MSRFTAGQKLRASQLNGIAMDTAFIDKDTTTVAGTTTSTAYTTALTGAGARNMQISLSSNGVGVLVIRNSANVRNATAADNALCSIEVRTGATVGSGTVILAAADTQALSTTTGGAAQLSATRVTTLTPADGITPNTVYNVQTWFRVNGGTGTFTNMELVAEGW
jgi:hypothetical protein